MKRALVILGVASTFALAGCGNGTTGQVPLDEPLPGEQQPMPEEPGMPGDDGIDDDLQP
ncbi:MAG: hypothetical protein ACXIUP_08410 [Microcella sp.]